MKRLGITYLTCFILLASICSSVPANFQAPWDLLFDFEITIETGLIEHSGAEFDGTYFYSTKGASTDLIHKYDIDGNLVDEFSIPGVPGLQDLAYDGTYFYGGAVDYTIYQMDFASETLVGTIPSPERVSGIAYNEDLDAFYVSWWSFTVVLIARDGTVLETISMGPPANARFGLAYDNVSPDGPYLWVFDQGSLNQYERARIYQWDLIANDFTGFFYDVGADFGSGWGIAKGLFTTADYAPGRYCIGGLIADNGFPPDDRYEGDWMFVYELLITNLPPVVPGAPIGPTEGVVGVDYTFAAVTTDPENDDISYMFDWGDGSFSDWIGPYPSGTEIAGTHSWDAAGDYDIKVKAKDAYSETDWSAAHTFTILEGPILNIRPLSSGLFRLKATIRNDGAVEATDVSWSLSLEGGAFIGAESSGTIASILPGNEVEINSGLIIGLGATAITVTASIDQGISDVREQTGTILLFFILVNPGGG